MKIDILTLFPEMFKGPFDESMIKRAQEKGLVEIKVHNLRDWAKDKHKSVDDRPYGGGPGMVLMVEPIYLALQELETSNKKQVTRKILLTPQGKVFNQKRAQQISKLNHLIFIVGHYEGVDERVREHLIDEEISIGDYVLTGGELPVMVVVDAIVRLIPGVLGDSSSLEQESFSVNSSEDKSSSNLLEYPQYTRPDNYKGRKVPKVLLSGNHAEIEKWRKEQAIKRTKKKRPDLVK